MQGLGGNTPLCQFLANGNVIQDYSAATTCSWTPATAGVYALTINIQDPNGANPAQVYSSPALMYTITQPLTAVSLNPPTPASPAPVDTAIILSASATGGAGVVYQFLADGVVISDYNASSSCVWTPTADGVYQLTVNAMDLNGVDPTQVISSTAMAFTVLPVAVADNYQAIAGQTLTVSAANGLLTNDLGSATLTVAGYTNPANGVLAVNGDGSFTYQPNAGFYGNDTFTYTAADGVLASAPATVTITVIRRWYCN